MAVANKPDWNQYAKARFLGRNRLTMEHHQEVVADFVRYFATQSSELNVLDIGCSAGFFLTLLRELGFQNLEGCDISEHFVKQAREKGLNCVVTNVLAGNAGQPTSKKYDVVMMMDLLEHLEDPASALDTVRRNHLKSDGILFVTVPIYDSLYEKYERLRLRKSKMQQAREHDPTHVQAFSEGAIHQVLHATGFKVTESRRMYCAIPGVRSVRVRTIAKQLLPAAWKGKFLRVTAYPGVVGPDGSR